jgi:hypothetical protein
VSKANAKQQATAGQTAQELQAPQAASGQPADAGAAPLVSAAAPAALTPDEYHGQGGLYTMKDGRRVLVEQTQPETTKERK